MSALRATATRALRPAQSRQLTPSKSTRTSRAPASIWALSAAAAAGAAARSSSPRKATRAVASVRLALERNVVALRVAAGVVLVSGDMTGSVRPSRRISRLHDSTVINPSGTARGAGLACIDALDGGACRAHRVLLRGG